MTNRLALLVAVVVFIAVPLESQTTAPPSLSFGSATLSLGMPIETIVTRLADNYTFERSTGRVWSKDGRTIHGALRFDRSNRLIQASQTLDSSGPSGVPTVEALYNALAQVTAPRPAGTRLCRCEITLRES